MELAKSFNFRKTPISDVLNEDEKITIKTIIGVDLGETFSGGFCAKDLSEYNEEGKFNEKSSIKNLAIRTSAISEPLRKFRNWLNHQKTEVILNDLILEYL